MNSYLWFVEIVYKECKQERGICMKKGNLIMLAGLVLLALTGCGSKDNVVMTPAGEAVITADGKLNITKENKDVKEQKASEPEKEEENKTETGLLHVGFAQVGSESGWRLAQTDSMKAAFTEENGYQFDFVDCNNDQKAQISALDQFIADKVDYIVLDPIVEGGYDEVLKKAKDAAIPVIVVDRNISADSSLYTCWVGSDFTKEGKDAANWLIEDLDKKNRGAEELNILTIMGSNGASATIGRTDGFEEIAKTQTNWKLLDKQYGDFTKDGGNAVMKAFLKQYKDIDVLVCQNDDEAFGAIEAIKEAGKTCGPNGDIILISFDAGGAAFQAMIDGDINVDVECNPLEGPVVSDIIQKLSKGEEVEQVQYMPEEVFPAETAAEILPGRAY